MEEKKIKINVQKHEPLSPGENKQPKRYTHENKKVTQKLNETETGPRRSRGKKQRRQFKLAPNRG